MIKIWYKSTCSTCHTALALIKKETDEEISLFEYSINAPTQKEIREILKFLNLKVEDLIRKKEKLFKEKYADKKLSKAQWIKVLAENPILIERPIVVKDGKAILGRPVQKVVEIFD
ncbi:MAG: arsenate reductase (glutaredoxin) [Bacteroidia bacterium]|nr:arsenate reductase (glutaredoxin) [Bacteroidia bacterium]